MLPSTFIPTCAKCSTAAPGLVSIRGDATSNVCRSCHAKFTFKIPDVRFQTYTPGLLSAPAAGVVRARAEKLGLHAGDPLPSRGACAHYRKSYRWFRFSCCSRVHACDRCHDEAEDHVNEWASRMVCGWCSREQRYAVDACGFCGRSVIGRKGHGFWEGGKGTRDRALMSRKDKRNFIKDVAALPRQAELATLTGHGDGPRVIFSQNIAQSRQASDGLEEQPFAGHTKPQHPHASQPPATQIPR
ncbi:CHY zinc finger domain-containing protein [Verticillium alfalfae VaMs.102]|uniref:CHY zinc finger domain-containing protein n=1 Tax=Verticillium alfalfae (strain VaMs.102 / ATCC MYA-4576 / FGSC 10136) TaxID=526221 RepID=C9SSR1_VERA1|nr:CHY zinc finger domain-containing protein [Verticillium alfalfae VaMs.102]EEY21826.1 CHY zinc finger domain-containing protein [Verticillium alfalfae VaMs.102]